MASDDYESGRNDGNSGYVNSNNMTNESYRSGVEDSQRGQACMPGRVLVETPSGNLRLDTIKAGDEVVSWDARRAVATVRTVKKVRAFGLRSVHEIRLADGRIIAATLSHSLMTGRGWRKVSELKIGDELETTGLQACRIVAIQRCKERELVYNIVSSGEHTFVTTGVVSHNFTVLRGLRSAIDNAFESLGRRLRITPPEKPLTDQS